MFKLIAPFQGRNYVSAYRNNKQIGVLICGPKGKWLAFAATAIGLQQIGSFHKSMHAAVAVLLRACRC
ncbi:protein of unknown function [Candidatus Filomicrobium marinum]|uniref:Uncharacterized protein n=1 Tax=Candidatus Filomicrobium marinum TaxID=1608628 RepID=A0A0D6JIN0_9HYPH|nr:protein of unknown function [Candidatus Filomicrobium marinum]CPR21859.1 protein of unknown function [Candidatus Filomicrobium marinum]